MYWYGVPPLTSTYPRWPSCRVTHQNEFVILVTFLVRLLAFIWVFIFLGFIFSSSVGFFLFFNYAYCGKAECLDKAAATPKMPPSASGTRVVQIQTEICAN